WDLEVAGGLLGGARALLAIEEHGAGRQLLRLKSWPHIPIPTAVGILLLGGLAMAAASQGAWLASGVLGFAAAFAGYSSFRQSRAALGAVASAFPRMQGQMAPDQPLVLVAAQNAN
ncbi:MAG: hypothetical protein OEU26_22915, partial [Candidatus Tectomicrobia bacterium]|nr:hypothetical protein [Candidatus Tectomicrobia bacterium]